MSNTQPPLPQPKRKSTLDADTMRELEQQLRHRPDKSELVERDILKGGQNSLDEDGVHRLEKQLQHRPEKSELMERNILKDDRVAPSLQAAKEQLEKSQLQDKLGHALQRRPTADKLVKEGILQPGEVPKTA